MASKYRKKNQCFAETKVHFSLNPEAVKIPFIHAVQQSYNTREWNKAAPGRLRLGIRKKFLIMVKH